MIQSPPKPIRAVIVDDRGVLRSVMTLALSSMDGITVVGQASNGREAVDVVLEEEPDVVLMDILMPLLDGLEATRRILRDFARARVVVLTGAADPNAVLDVLRAGACGLVAKTADLAEVETALRVASDGGIYVSPDLAGPVLARVAARPSDGTDDELARLSTRERGIVQLVGEGESTREISEGLFISPKTVAQHKSNIVKKLGLKNTRELQILAAKRAAGWRTVAAGDRSTPEAGESASSTAAIVSAGAPQTLLPEQGSPPNDPRIDPLPRDPAVALPIAAG